MKQTENISPVMLVDDDKDILQVMKMTLQHAGYQVHSFTKPVLAIQHIEHGCKECEILISDIKMPDMTGFELVRRVRDLRPEMKIVMMTAFEVNKKEFQTLFPSTPIDKVVRKPFTMSILADIIKETNVN